VAQCAAPVGQIAYGLAFKRFYGAVYIPLLIAGLLTSCIALMGKITLKKEGFIDDTKRRLTN
jgi:hypothetical protein